MAYDEPPFTVLRNDENFELRHYPSYVVAELAVSSDYDDAGGVAFGPLARYIGGENIAYRETPAGAPMTQLRSGIEIPMTAPVTQVAGKSGQHVVQFIMPASFTLETTPKPNDSRIRIREIPERTLAVRRYSGRWTLSNLEREEGALREALVHAQLEIVGAMEWARFNSPFSLPFLRRNEVWIPVAPPGDAPGS
ncbi:MAG: heme-binding protein [Myxococcota bacterium]